MDKILLNRYEGSTVSNLNELVNDIRGVESSGGTLLVNPKSTARGDFQFLTTEGKGQNAFQTALNRYSATLKANDKEVPSWVDEARTHNDPMKLSYENQRELMLANIYQQKGSDDLFRKALSGDSEAGKQLYYLYHHTNPDDATKKVANKYFGETTVAPKSTQQTQIVDPSRTYIVQQGDTLSKIARENGLTVDQLVRHNAITDPNKISVGQVIYTVPEIAGLKPVGVSSSGRQEYSLVDKFKQMQQASKEVPPVNQGSFPARNTSGSGATTGGPVPDPNMNKRESNVSLLDIIRSLFGDNK